jgi:hypothetical protein
MPLATAVDRMRASTLGCKDVIGVRTESNKFSYLYRYPGTRYKQATVCRYSCRVTSAYRLISIYIRHF